MKIKQLILLVLLTSPGILNAQTDFRPGYIIMTTGDTIYGQIDYRGDLIMRNLCKFKDVNNRIVEYSPEDIDAFRFPDSKYYVSKEIDNKKVFMEYLIHGIINIYYTRDDNGNHYYIDKGEQKLIELPYEEGVRYVDGKNILYQSKTHINILNYYMRDAPDLQPKIKSVKKPGHQDLIRLAENYHNAVCQGEQCIIYEKSVPLFKIQPELTVSTIRYSNVDDLTDKFYLNAGIIAHIWMPRTNEKMYFRTGVLYSQLDFDGEKLNYYRIPCQIEYIYPKGILRPRIAYGLNFYILRYQSVSLDIGANIKLSETLFLSTSSEIEFNHIIMVLPKSMLSYSFKLGLFLSIE